MNLRSAMTIVRDQTIPGLRASGGDGHVAALETVLEAAEWKDAVIDALVINWHLSAENENNPRLAISELIRSEQELALDPLVSQAAADLIERGRAEVRAEYVCDCGRRLGPGRCPICDNEE